MPAKFQGFTVLVALQSADILLLVVEVSGHIETVCGLNHFISNCVSLAAHCLEEFPPSNDMQKTNQLSPTHAPMHLYPRIPIHIN